jgi:translation elongation factor EF-G
MVYFPLTEGGYIMAIKKSSGTKTSVRKPAKTKAAGKKTAKKKAVAKKLAVKKAMKKSAAGRSVRKITPKKKAVRKTKPSSDRVPSKGPAMVQPGPPPGSVPPVEEPSLLEEAIGIVTHYYSHLGVAVVQVNKGSLKTGDRIHITGHSTDFTQTVASMEYEHQHVDQASAGQSVGLKIADHTREHDIVYLVK